MVRLNKIYTRTGDAGETGLGSGERRAEIRRARRRLWRGRRAQLRDRPGAAAHARQPGSRPHRAHAGARAERSVRPRRRSLRAALGRRDRRACARRPRRRWRWSAPSTISTPSFSRSGPSCCRAARRRPPRCIRRARSAGAPSGRSCCWRARRRSARRRSTYVNRLSDYLFVAARYANDRGAERRAMGSRRPPRGHPMTEYLFAAAARSLAARARRIATLSRARASSASGAITRSTPARWAMSSIARSRSISARARTPCARTARRSAIRPARPIIISRSNSSSRSAGPRSRRRRRPRSAPSTATPSAST